MSLRNAASAWFIAVSVLAGASVAPADTEQFTIMSSGEKVGQLTAEVNGSDVAIHYQIVNNGRGPHLDERLTLDPNGIPISWTSDGLTAFFGVVHERYNWSGGRAA